MTRMEQLTLRRTMRFWNTRLREWRMIASGLLSSHHPVLAHLIPIRRCNLSCSYCNEFDKVSKPLPLDIMFRRVDRLAALGTTIITLSGGEPLLHPELEEIVQHIRRRGILAGLITNGYLLTPQRIEHLNRAGLDHLQISIDNVIPDEISKKSLRVLDRKLRLLARYAIFQVNIIPSWELAFATLTTLCKWPAGRLNWVSRAPWASSMTTADSLSPSANTSNSSLP